MNKVFNGTINQRPGGTLHPGKYSMAVGRYTLAVDRRFKKDGEATADFINCVAFSETGRICRKILPTRVKGNHFRPNPDRKLHNREGRKVYTTDVVVEEQDSAESKGDSSRKSGTAAGELTEDEDGFMNIPEGIEEEMPFS